MSVGLLVVVRFEMSMWEVIDPWFYLAIRTDLFQRPNMHSTWSAPTIRAWCRPIPSIFESLMLFLVTTLTSSSTTLRTCLKHIRLRIIYSILLQYSVSLLSNFIYILSLNVIVEPILQLVPLGLCMYLTWWQDTLIITVLCQNCTLILLLHHNSSKSLCINLALFLLSISEVRVGSLICNRTRWPCVWTAGFLRSVDRIPLIWLGPRIILSRLWWVTALRTRVRRFPSPFGTSAFGFLGFVLGSRWRVLRLVGKRRRVFYLKVDPYVWWTDDVLVVCAWAELKFRLIIILSLFIVL